MNFVNTLYNIDIYKLLPTDKFPNNASLPVIHYKGVLNTSLWMAAFKTKHLLQNHEWLPSRKSGILCYHHYHSNAHEVLAVLEGETLLLLGGEGGSLVNISAGDVLIIPAGVAHKNCADEYNVLCIGAYYGGAKFDMNYGHPGERPGTDKTIKNLAVPDNDPVFGNGPLQSIWGSVSEQKNLQKIS
jgi:uncharacterized protein YjlB